MNPENSSFAPAHVLNQNLSTLRRRRQSLARPFQEDDSEDSLEIVVFYLGAPFGVHANANQNTGGEKAEISIAASQYAFETSQVGEVFPVPNASQIAALPGTPPWVRGILNVRGRILAVLDLQRLFGLPVSPTIADAPVLILRGEGIAQTIADGEVVSGDVALATNGVVGVRILPRTQLETGHALDGTPGARYLRGLTADGVALLDAALLFGDAKLIVQAE